MENVHSEFLRADSIIIEYAQKENKFSERFSALSKEINIFIEKMDLKDKAVLNELALGYALIDYFEDVHRLKVFHKVEHINSIKIVSYTSFWLLKRKPIQMITCEKELIDINERFVLQYILSFLSNKTKKHILIRDNIGLTSFVETLLYFLKYRLTTANNIEMVLMAFFAGQIYQEENEDLSSKLGKMNEE
ncbi:MAG: hypothetical protein IJ871_09110 [Ruminococcus sp.]|nr:hypothetical protein [Ruminococcus sp.]